MARPISRRKEVVHLHRGGKVTVHAATFAGKNRGKVQGSGQVLYTIVVSPDAILGTYDCHSVAAALLSISNPAPAAAVKPGRTLRAVA